MKKTLSFIILLSILFQICMPILMQYEVQADNSVTWDISKNNDGTVTATLSEDGILTISGNGEMASWSLNEEPWYDRCYKIKKINIAENIINIGSSAFSSCSSLTSIEIPNSVTSIGKYAFNYCSSLTSIEIPSGVTSIGEHAFEGCSSLTSIEVNINNINYSSENGVLFNKDKTELICYPIKKEGTYYAIPNSVTSIGKYAFKGCSSLTSIEIPSDVTSIGYSAFSSCSSLMSIEIPSGVTSIEDFAFSSCSSLTSIEIPNSVTSIGKYAFNYCSSLTSIEIPNSVRIIGYYAFSYCSLTSIEIPSSVTSIGRNAFGSSALTSIEVDINNINYSSENGVLFNKDKTELICYPIKKEGTYYAIPNSVRIIGYYAFSYCSLTSIEIPNSVTSIEYFAFSHCNSLTSIEIPNSVTSITCWVFECCSGLTSIKIPNSVTRIEGGAFGNCSSLTSIEIPNSVTSIENYAFQDCSSLTSIKIPNSVTSIGIGAIDSTTVIYTKSNTEAQRYAEENNQEYIIDDEKPEVIFETNGNSNPSEKQSTKVTVTDEVTGVNQDSLKYKWTQSTTKPEEEDFVDNFSNGQTIEKSDGDGQWYLWILAKDEVGNTTIVRSKAFVLDNAPLIVEVSYSTEELANQVTVTITSNKPIQGKEDWKTAGWEMSENNQILTKEYNKNTSEVITVKDLAGNTKEVNININNIFIDPDIQTVGYYTVEYKYIVENNIIKQCIVMIEGPIISLKEGWTLLDNTRSKIYKTFYSNETELINTNFLMNEINVEVTRIGEDITEPTSPEAPDTDTTITFEDENLYNGIVQALGEKIENQDYEQKTIIMKAEEVANVESLDFERMGIKNLAGIEKFTNLRILQVCNNKIEDITALQNNSSIEELDLSDNSLENDDLVALSTMSKLKNLDISLNKNITDISPIYSITTLEGLTARNNSITSLTGIEQLTNLTSLNVYRNQIKEMPDLSNIQEDNLDVRYQTYTKTIIDKQQGKIEIELPQTFIQAQDSNSRYYSEEGLDLVYCEWNEDKTKIIIDAENVFNTNAKITISSGELKGSELFLYGVGIRYYIDNTEIQLLDVDLDVNSDGEVTLADVEPMKNYVEGGNYTQEQYQKFVKIDVDNNREIDKTDYTRFEKYINQETDILFTIMIDTTSKINENVIAQIHTYNPNIETNDEMYIFTENGEKEISFLDEEGEQQILIASVNCIDKKAPSYEIYYSTTEPTRDNVIVTIEADEELLDLYGDFEDENGEMQSTGWVLAENKKTLQKTYTENTTETVFLADEVGNITEIEVIVDNISKNAPASGKLIIKKQNALGEDYKENTWTNENIYIAIDEKSKPENTTMKYQINGEGNYTQSQTLTQDGNYEITLTTTDNLGNSVTVTYHVKIDKTNPEVGTLRLKSESSIGDELANGIITNKNVYVNLEDATDDLSGIAENYYIVNGNEENKLTESEIFRNEGTYELKVVTIDKAGNTAQKEYSFTINKQAPELKTEYEKQADGTVKVKIISTNNIPLKRSRRRKLAVIRKQIRANQNIQYRQNRRSNGK